MKRDTINYILVGGFVLCMFLLLLVALYRITGRNANADTYLAFYHNVSGIHEGSKVCFGGYQIGQVAGIEPDRHEGAVRFKVTMAVRHAWQIPQDSVARIVMPAVLSDKQVDIRPGVSTKLLAPGAVLASAEGSNVMETMGALAYEMKDLSEKSLRPLITSFNRNLNTVGKNLNDTLPELADNTNRLIGSINESVVRFNALLDNDNRAHVNHMLANGDTIAANLVAVTGDFSRASRQLEQLLADSRTLVNDNNGDVRQAVIDLRDTLATMARHMDAIVYNLEGTTRNMHEFTREIRENPGRLIRDQPPEESAVRRACHETTSDYSGRLFSVAMYSVHFFWLSAVPPTAPVPVDHFYRLPEPRPAAATGRVFSGTLAVGRVRAGGLYNDRSFLYVDSAVPLEIRPYRYHLWHDAPAALIRAHFRAFLQAAGAADEVLPLDTDLRPDLLLQVRIQRFEQLLDEHGTQVVVALAFTGRAAGRQPWYREYSVTERAKGEGMQATVAAFGEALDAIYAMLLRDAG